MKRPPLLLLAVLLSVLSSGCITAWTTGMIELGSGRPPRGHVYMLVTVPLDVVTSPLQLPFWLDYGCAECCVDYFYPYGWWNERRDRCVAALEKDFDEALVDPRYFQKYDEEGRATPEFAALCEYFNRYWGTHLYTLSKRQAEYVATQALENQEIFEDLLGIWHSKVLDPKLRMQALAVLRRQGDTIGQHYRELLEFPEVTDAMLQEIVDSPSCDYGSRKALQMILERREAEMKRKQAQAEAQKAEAERKARQKREEEWNLRENFKKNDQEKLQQSLAAMEKPGVRTWLARELDSSGVPPLNAMKIVMYELEHMGNTFHQEDCCLVALRRNRLSIGQLNYLRPKLLAVAATLPDRKAAHDLVRAYCGNWGQDIEEAVICYVDPQLAWLREEVLRMDCIDIEPARKAEMCRELDQVHAEFRQHRNCDEELKRVDAVLRKYQPQSIPPMWFVKIEPEGNLHRLKEASRFLGLSVDQAVAKARSIWWRNPNRNR